MREPCRTCPERTRDFGGCRCQAALLTGDPANTDPVCTLSPNRKLVDEILTTTFAIRRWPSTMDPAPSPRSALAH
jgi:pyrroloquinoline quinone biosynthesis protein E